MKPFAHFSFSDFSKFFGICNFIDTWDWEKELVSFVIASDVMLLATPYFGKKLPSVFNVNCAEVTFYAKPFAVNLNPGIDYRRVRYYQQLKEI